MKKRPYKHWTTDDNWQLAGLLDRGMTYREIAAEMGRTPSACRNQAHKLGLKSKVRPADGAKYVKRTAKSAPQETDRDALVAAIRENTLALTRLLIAINNNIPSGPPVTPASSARAVRMKNGNGGLREWLFG